MFNNQLETILNKTRPGWKERQLKRKSPWHIVKVILLFSLIIGLLYSSVIAYQQIQLAIFATADLDNSGFGIVILIFPIMSMSIILTNVILYLVPTARNSFNKEAEGDSELELAPFMKTFIPITFKYIVPVCFSISAVVMWLCN